MSEIIKIENHGALIAKTNYWQSDWCDRALYYLSVNAGAFRLLCPRGKGADIKEMRTGKEIVISIGPSQQFGREMIELLFDDRSQNPFALFLDIQQCDRLPSQNDYNRPWVFSAWEGRHSGGAHQVLNRKAWLRTVPDIPFLQPWQQKN